MKLLYLTILLSVLMSFPVSFEAQERQHPFTRDEIDAILNPSLLPNASNILSFENNIINIGEMCEDDEEVAVKFGFKNISSKEVVITRITTDCGCTEAKVDNYKILPGKYGIITVVYNPKNHPGTINANTLVYSSISDKKPIAKLVLLGEVKPSRDEWYRFPYTMGKLRLKQNKVIFDLSSANSLTERILCGNSGDKDIELSVFNLPDFMEFNTEPKVISPGKEADIVIRIDKSKIKTKFSRKLFPLIINGVNVRPTDRTLNIEVILNSGKQ